MRSLTLLIVVIVVIVVCNAQSAFLAAHDLKPGNRKGIHG
jgi:hypothetical protein